MLLRKSIPDGPAPVHCAVTLQVRAGREAEFEALLLRFVQRSLDYRVSTGVHLIRPIPGSGSREYGILRSFMSDDHRREFYESEAFKQYKVDTRDLVEGEPVVRSLHGLEAFFRNGASSPPRWKMAIVTWLGVFPTVLFWTTAFDSHLTSLHPIVVTAVVTILTVITLAWCAMPFLVNVFRPWLHQT